MKKAFFMSLLSALLCISCTATTAFNSDVSEAQDDLFKKQIIGKWVKGTSPYSIAAFREGGAYENRVYGSPNKGNLLYASKGKWWIKKGTLYKTLAEITPAVPDLYTDEVIKNRIVSISDNTLSLIDKHGHQYIESRLNE